MTYQRIHAIILKHKDRSAGQGLVELALLIPLLLLLILGVFDLGRAFFSIITITNAAREGARYGLSYPNDTLGIQNATVNEANGSGIPVNLGDVSVDCVDMSTPFGKCDPGLPITVTVQHSFDLTLGWLLPSPIDFSRSAVMLVP
jgi:Flp pilus assembly protein TadG